MNGNMAVVLHLEKFSQGATETSPPGRKLDTKKLQQRTNLVDLKRWDIWGLDLCWCVVICDNLGCLLLIWVGLSWRVESCLGLKWFVFFGLTRSNKMAKWMENWWEQTANAVCYEQGNHLTNCQNIMGDFIWILDSTLSAAGSGFYIACFTQPDVTNKQSAWKLK